MRYTADSSCSWGNSERQFRPQALNILAVRNRWATQFLLAFFTLIARVAVTDFNKT
jgi:hypothetical protein